MQAILGAGGSIGNLLAKELKAYTDKIRLVSRHPKKINDDDELFTADLTDANAILKAVEGSDVVYITVGLTYDLKVWEKQWPIIMRNVIDACLANNAKLVFFDNVYMYAADEIPHMTEKSRLQPPSQKGKVRLLLINMIFDAIKEKGLKALIARNADFYGPDSKNSVFDSLVIDNLKKGKRAFWQSDVNKIHSFTYTPDAAKATALLGNTASAYGQTWHLPTSAEKLTGKQLITLAANGLGVKPKYFVMSPFLISIMGLFSTQIKEIKEMQYQNNRDYFFDSEKFCNQFHFRPTSYKEGISIITHQ